jgi:hypothetical protein
MAYARDRGTQARHSGTLPRPYWLELLVALVVVAVVRAGCA